MYNQYYDSYDKTPENQRPEATGSQPENHQEVFRWHSYYAPQHTHHTAPVNRSSEPEPKVKKQKGRMSTGAVAAILVLCVLLSGAAGFGGSYLFSQINASSGDSAIQINKANVDNVVKTSAEQTEKSTNEIVSEVADSVVEITVEVVQTDMFYGEQTAEGAGSGVIISEDGYILTNNHVAGDASKITVTLRSGESYDAKLIGTDADLDIALIKIDASGLCAAPVGDSSTVSAGDKSVIIGNPLGTLGGSVTEGIISAVDRELEIDGRTMHLMQTDAAVNPGNSGGGMFNSQGELVGIVVAKSAGDSTGSSIDNIGFVIPINSALDILGDLKQYGYVRGKAYTGMAYSEGSSGGMYAQYFGYGGTSDGVYIASIKSGSNAAKAGFSVGDRVVSVDGNAVNTVSDLKKIITDHSVGDTVSFELERGGRTGTIELTLEEYVPTASA